MYGKRGIETGFFGKKHTNETKRNMRITAIERITRYITDGSQLYPFYNSSGCKLIDEYGNLHGYDFQHAQNGGEFYIKELGYWVDGYDKEKNVVIEVDEKHHFDVHGNLLEKDIERQKEIENYLGCQFIRIKLIK